MLASEEVLCLMELLTCVLCRNQVICNEMEILSFVIILICTEFRHSGNSDCSSSWLVQLTFAVPYIADLITQARLELHHRKESIT